MRFCSKCGQMKEIADFYVCATYRNADRCSSYCKVCTLVAVKRWRSENRDKIRAYKKRYAATEKGRRMKQEASRRYWEQNREKMNRQRWKVRFEVLARDKFTCQYCGRKAPDVVLEIDHFYPRSKGGASEGCSPRRYRWPSMMTYQDWRSSRNQGLADRATGELPEG